MNSLRFLDFFAGIGGFRRGLEMAGHKCVGFCEWDKFATASYVSMHCITDEQRAYLATLDLKKRQKEILKDEYRNGEWYADDIRGVEARDLPDGVQLYCFGAPCQDFSVAGKRAGLDGERSVLVQEIFRLLEEQQEENRPEWLIYENVKGMFSSNRGLDYLSILSELDRLGYDCEWQNINSAWYVPQNRERIYTIGHLRRYGSAKIFPISAADGENRVSIIGHRNGYRRNTQTFSPDGITEAMDTGAGGGRGHYVAEPCFCDMSRSGGGDSYGNSTGIRSEIFKRGSESESGMFRYSHSDRNKGGVRIMCNSNPSGNGMNGNVFDTDGNAPTLTTNKGEGNKIGIKITDDIKLSGNNYNQRKTVNGNGEASRTVMGCGHSGNEPKVAIPVLTPDRAEKRQNGRRMKDDGDPSFTLTAEDRHGVAVEPIGGVYTHVSSDFQHGIYDGEARSVAPTQSGGVALGVIDTQGRTEKTVDPKETAPTLRAQTHGNVPEVVEQVDTETDQHEPIYVQFENGVTAYAVWYEKYQCYITIRKLTPKECFRLQGWDDEYFERAEFVNSDSQLYKQAGNGVTVNVVYEIGKRLMEENE